MFVASGLLWVLAVFFLLLARAPEVASSDERGENWRYDDANRPDDGATPFFMSGYCLSKCVACPCVDTCVAETWTCAYQRCRWKADTTEVRCTEIPATRKNECLKRTSRETWDPISMAFVAVDLCISGEESVPTTVCTDHLIPPSRVCTEEVRTCSGECTWRYDCDASPCRAVDADDWLREDPIYDSSQLHHEGTKPQPAVAIRCSDPMCDYDRKYEPHAEPQPDARCWCADECVCKCEALFKSHSVFDRLVCPKSGADTNQDASSACACPSSVPTSAEHAYLFDVALVYNKASEADVRLQERLLVADLHRAAFAWLTEGSRTPSTTMKILSGADAQTANGLSPRDVATTDVVPLFTLRTHSAQTFRVAFAHLVKMATSTRFGDFFRSSHESLGGTPSSMAIGGVRVESFRAGTSSVSRPPPSPPPSPPPWPSGGSIARFYCPWTSLGGKDYHACKLGCTCNCFETAERFRFCDGCSCLSDLEGRHSCSGQNGESISCPPPLVCDCAAIAWNERCSGCVDARNLFSFAMPRIKAASYSTAGVGELPTTTPATMLEAREVPYLVEIHATMSGGVEAFGSSHLAAVELRFAKELQLPLARVRAQVVGASVGVSVQVALDDEIHSKRTLRTLLHAFDEPRRTTTLLGGEVVGTPWTARGPGEISRDRDASDAPTQLVQRPEWRAARGGAMAVPSHSTDHPTTLTSTPTPTTVPTSSLAPTSPLAPTETSTSTPTSRVRIPSWAFPLLVVGLLLGSVVAVCGVVSTVAFCYIDPSRARRRRRVEWVALSERAERPRWARWAQQTHAPRRPRKWRDSGTLAWTSGV